MTVEDHIQVNVIAVIANSQHSTHLILEIFLSQKVSVMPLRHLCHLSLLFALKV